MAGNRILSYVAALAEVGARDNLYPEYDLLKVEGPCHDPVFVIRGSVGKYEATGRGSKKQSAKQDAAKQILLDMGELSLEDLKIVESKAGYNSAKVIGNVVDGFVSSCKTGPGAIPIADELNRKRNMYTPIPAGNLINPLGDLIEMSAIMGWPHPCVEDEQKTGPAHDPRFTVSCYFAKYKTFATSKSKKEAKRLAALEMYENMRYQPEIMYKFAVRSGRPMDSSAVYANNFESIDSGKFATPSDFCFSGVTKILEISESRTVEMLKKIKSVDELANPEVVLQNVVSECHFQMQFEVLEEDLVCRVLDIDAKEEQPKEPRHMLMMPLQPRNCGPLSDGIGAENVNEAMHHTFSGSKSSSLPKDIYTVYCVLKLPIRSSIRLLGYGPNIEDAKYNAVRKTLQYIQLMVMKDPL